MASSHLLVLPFPCQGHVIPLMELSHRLVEHGFEVTFVNNELNHALVLEALAQKGKKLEGINMVSIPDGLEAHEDRKDLNKLIDGFSTAMPGHLEELITKINESSGSNRIRWLIADQNMGWSIHVAKKMGIRAVSFIPPSAACLAIMLKIPQLIQNGVLDEMGWPKRRNETFQLSPGMPPIDTNEFSWNRSGAPEGQHIIFQLVLRNNQATELADLVICNSFHEIEEASFKLFPNLLPIGPLLADRASEKPVGHFLNEDATCLSWLDKQPEDSVVYVAFGSFTIFDPRQFQQLAEGLELSGRPFLWVVRPDFTTGLSKAWLEEFQDRVAGTGMIVSWCPQQQVLAHPSVACFVSHCGWNSTVEGVRNGVPFLCWPYFCDQFLNQSYICNVWKTGLKMTPDETGIISKEQVRIKVEKLLGDAEIKERTRMLKDAACRCTSAGGPSYENFRRLVRLISE